MSIIDRDHGYSIIRIFLYLVKEKTIQKYTNRKYYMRNVLYRYYTDEALETSDVVRVT